MAATSSSKRGSGKVEQGLSEEVSAELAELRKDITALTKTLSAFGEARLDGLSEATSASTEETIKNARQMLNKLRIDMQGLEKGVEEKVANNPIQSILMAVGLGFLVALVLRR